MDAVSVRVGNDDGPVGHHRNAAGATKLTRGVAKASNRREEGAVGWGVLWLIGVPIPILIIAFLLRGCT